jgi:2-oxoisovalerate dehydrogenase E1 component
MSVDEILEYIDSSALEVALRIRSVETALLSEFQKGSIAGTIHTCIGQELSPALIGNLLGKKDFITSNHRCHGHFIAKTRNWKGLILEILGSREGVCRGVGSSQHLYSPGFLSNGPQGSLLPVGTGIANWFNNYDSEGIVVSFIGEGTLGEGITFEAMNLAAVTSSAQLFVCENNFYSQSTSQGSSTAGAIIDKPNSFGIRTFVCNIWEPQALAREIRNAIEFVRNERLPGFLLIQCYRLNAHSKGDDNREISEIQNFLKLDPLTRLLENSTYFQDLYEEIDAEVKTFLLQNSVIENLDYVEYAVSPLPRKTLALSKSLTNDRIRTVEAIRLSLAAVAQSGGLLIGEDLRDPYGGAFKATKGISTDHPLSVINSPISEAGFVGFAIGTALMGQPAIAEIMFGDFITYALDQIVNNASKFFHVYGLDLGLPILIRVPSGGHRGYGPTHSQSLEKFLVGIDNVLVIAITSLVDPKFQFNAALELKIPTVVIENKIGYSRILFQNENAYTIEREIDGLGSLVCRSTDSIPDVTVISYGELARELVDSLQELEDEFNIKIEIICLLQLHPLRTNFFSQRTLGHLTIVAEEGSKEFALGAEIAAVLAENSNMPDIFRRVSAEAFPIASNRNLEEELLANVSKVRDVILKEMQNAE